MLRIAGILESSGVAFTTFQFTGEAFTWWEAYERRRLAGAAPLTWKEFSTLFLEKWIPLSQREELRRQFEWLRQGDMTVSQYEARFSELARYALWIVPTDRERIKRFVDGERGQEASRFWQFQGAPSRGQFQQGRSRSFRPSQSARPEYRGGSSGRGYQGSHQSQPSLSTLPAQSSSRAPSAQGSSRPSASASHSSTRGSLQSQFPVPGSCYECGEFRHMRWECPRRAASSSYQRGQSSSSGPVSSAPAPPARGFGSGSQGSPQRGRPIKRLSGSLLCSSGQDICYCLGCCYHRYYFSLP
ncbi:uncharacterized protein [Nicotiana sylvestris]|uniref:uncharacterized protein n=1 Tax=Nicotiana sylvestris TaxID=4096 RepID=UPI00388CEB07